MNLYSYFMNTGAQEDYEFGPIFIRSIGLSGRFRICSESPVSKRYVAYLNGVRSTGIIGTSCSPTFDVGVGGDFQVYSRQTRIYGVHSGDTLSNENYQLLGMSSLF